MNTSNAIRIPTAFYIDHRERDLPAPPVIHRTKSHFWIEADHPDLPELLSDAEHYAEAIDTAAFPELFGLVTSARATKRAILRHSLLNER